MSTSGAGVLHIVKNYTGDVMNFEMAAELAVAEDISIESVIVDDDVAVQDSTFTAGRRGVGATVLVEKLAGAAADQGRSLPEVADVARRVNAAARSMGVALTSCTVPAVGHPTFDLSDTEMEVGIGIHGEPGRERMPVRPAREVAEMILDPILADLDFAGGDGVIVFVNGMGATPLIELYLMYAEVAAILDKSRVQIARSLVGPFITSLDMAGCSVTLLRADDRAAAVVGPPGQHPGAAEGLLTWPPARSTSAGWSAGSANSPAWSAKTRSISPISMRRSAMPTTASTWSAG